MNDDQQLPTPVIPERVRTGLYVAGAFLGLAGAPALAAVGAPELGVVAGALAGACNAVAFGYRPTRTTTGDA